MEHSGCIKLEVAIIVQLQGHDQSKDYEKPTTHLGLERKPFADAAKHASVGLNVVIPFGHSGKSHRGRPCGAAFYVGLFPNNAYGIHTLILNEGRSCNAHPSIQTAAHAARP